MTPVRERGTFESEVLALLRTSELSMSSADLINGFSEPKPAYTTLLTVLERLEKKGLVDKLVESPRKVRYRASQSQDDAAREAMVRALSKAQDRGAVLMKFAGDLSDDDLALLRRVVDHPYGSATS